MRPDQAATPKPYDEWLDVRGIQLACHQMCHRFGPQQNVGVFEQAALVAERFFLRTKIIRHTQPHAFRFLMTAQAPEKLFESGVGNN